LVIGLVLLVAITLVGVAAMSVSRMEITMSTNLQAEVAALGAAENTLASAEEVIATTYNGTPLWDWAADSTDGKYNYTEGDPGNVDPVAVLADSASTAVEATGSGNRYILEYLGPFTKTGSSFSIGKDNPANRRYLYRISAQGVSGKGGERYVQSIYSTID
jgi:type IV pilus assembly protein PilX